MNIHADLCARLDVLNLEEVEQETCHHLILTFPTMRLINSIVFSRKKIGHDWATV